MFFFKFLQIKIKILIFTGIEEFAERGSSCRSISEILAYHSNSEGSLNSRSVFKGSKRLSSLLNALLTKKCLASEIIALISNQESFGK